MTRVLAGVNSPLQDSRCLYSSLTGMAGAMAMSCATLLRAVKSGMSAIVRSDWLLGNDVVSNLVNTWRDRRGVANGGGADL